VPAEFRALIRGLVWVLGFVAIIPTQTDPDLWGNLKFGLDLLETWSFSTVDQYSFTQDIPWINHSWLPQVLMAAAYRAGGTAGIVVLKVLVVAAILWLVARAYAHAAPLVAEAAVLVVLITGIPVFVTARAQLWTVLGVVVLCRLILSPKPWAMAWAPLVMLVWVNAHVGWLIGIALLAWWAIGVFVRGPANDRYRAAGIAAAAVLATLVNPYGWRMWTFLFGVAHLSRDISEWQPLSAATLSNQIGVAVCLVAVLTLAARLPFERLASLVGLGYAAFRAVKFITLFITATVLFVAPVIVRRFPRSADAPRRLPTGMRVINGTAVVAVLAVALVNAWPRLTCLTSTDWRPDPQAGAALVNARASGRIAVTFDWGEYVIWHLGPQLRVSMDPRFDLVYSAKVVAEQWAVSMALPDGVAFLQRHRPEYVWYPQSDRALKAWLPDNGYRLDIDTPTSFIGVRRDLEPLRDPGPQSPGCFPLP
jgi:hypothetical protein